MTTQITGRSSVPPHYCRGRSILLLLTLALMLTVLLPKSFAAGAEPSVQCEDSAMPVQMNGLDLTSHGRLCVPARQRTLGVQVLLHGGTYNSSEWDFPYRPESYSYVRAANDSGYATYNVDSIGSGLSSRPPSPLVTAWGQAEVVHQIVTRLRQGAIAGQGFSKVVVIGHSMGSLTAVLEAGRFHDVDGVALTGFSHSHTAPIAVTARGGSSLGFLPATLSKFRSSADPGYLTTRPGVRERLYHSQSDVDSGVLRNDEANKDVVSATEFAQAIALASQTPVSRQIDVPVLLANGSKDGAFCDAKVPGADCSSAESLMSSEASFFSPAADLETYVLPGAGHTLMLAKNAGEFRSALLEWVSRTIQ